MSITWRDVLEHLQARRADELEQTAKVYVPGLGDEFFPAKSIGSCIESSGISKSPDEEAEAVVVGIRNLGDEGQVYLTL